MRLREIGSLLWRTADRFMQDGGMRSGAALAFYATLSLAPLVLLAVSAVSLLAHAIGARELITSQLGLVLGDEAMRVVQQVLANAPDQRSSILGMIGSGALLLFSGSVLFVNVQGTMNAMWNVRHEDQSIIRGMIRARIIAFIMILVTGLVLLASFLLVAAAGWLEPFLADEFAIGGILIRLLETGVSLIVLVLLCAAVYRILPDVEIAWRDVWFGATVTAVLFIIGRNAIGWYLSKAAAASRFGAAGSLFAFLLWVYYSAQIFFFGAELTQVRAEKRGSPIVPARGAVRVTMEVERSDGTEGDADRGERDRSPSRAGASRTGSAGSEGHDAPDDEEPARTGGGANAARTDRPEKKGSRGSAGRGRDRRSARTLR